MRDKLKDNRYFVSLIRDKKDSISFFKTALEQNEVALGREDHVKNSISACFIQSLISKYSAGYAIEELYADYYEALDYMHQSWMVLDNRAYLHETKYSHYFGSDYDMMLWMLSIGYLMDVDNEKYKLLLEILDRFEVRDLLYETIIKAKISERPTITEESYKMIFDMPWVYESLRQAIYEPDNEYGKERASALIERFLKKEFYPRHKGFSFYEHHKSSNNIYYGYWSFESTAVSKILDVDVSLFIENKYFPKDLYFYAKRNY